MMKLNVDKEKMKMTVCEKNKCCGCYACSEICPMNAVTVKDSIQVMEAYIDNTKCINCNMCKKVCPVNTPVVLNTPLAWYQGWSKDDRIRDNSASGGIASIISANFVNNGGIVCSCVYESGEFIYAFGTSIKELERFRGSKYVKSNPQKCYSQIKKYLQNGRKILFIGLPCHVASIKNFVGEQLQEHLYTVDLICHGTPSVKILVKFLNESGIQLHDTKSISFRSKHKFEINSDYTNLGKGAMDAYSIAFLEGLIYTENCYSCQFAQMRRSGDITIGDSWGSQYKNEIDKGISLILVNTNKGQEMIRTDNFIFLNVNICNAIEHNEQLKKPSIRRENLDEVFDLIKADIPLDHIVRKYCKFKSIKQDAKRLLGKIGLYHLGGV